MSCLTRRCSLRISKSNERAKVALIALLTSHHFFMSVHVASCLSTDVGLSWLQVYGRFPPKGNGHRCRVTGIWPQMPRSVAKGRLTLKFKTKHVITCATLLQLRQIGLRVKYNSIFKTEKSRTSEFPNYLLFSIWL